MPRRPFALVLSALFLAIIATGCPGAPRGGGADDDVARQNNLGVAWLGQQNWVEAETALREGLALSPDEPVLLVNLSIALVQQGRSDEARDALERALALDPDNLHARYDLGLLARSDGRLDEAIDHFEAVRAADPEDVSNLYNLGAAFAAEGDDARAEEAFRAALARNPVHTSANYGLGRLLVARGERDEGRRLVAYSQELRARTGVDDSVGNRYGEQGYYALGLDWPTDRLVPPPAEPLAWSRAGSIDGAGTWTAGLFAGGAARVVAAGAGGLVAFGEDATSAPFAPSPPGGAPLALAAGDVSGDGTLDILALSGPAAGSGRLVLHVLESAGTPDASWRPSSRRPGTAPAPASVDGAALVLVDRDHDGDLDALACWTSAGTTACRFATHGEPGRLAFDDDERGIPPVPNPAGGAVHVSFSDIDLDRDVDMLVGDAGGLRVYLNRRDGTFALDAESGLGGALAGLRAIDLADVDRDGRFDVLAATVNGVRFCRSGRGRPFRCEPLTDAPTDGVVALDADGDGLLDVAAGASDGGVTLLRHRGLEGFDAAPADAALAGAPRLAFDADGDLDPDLLTHSADGLRLARNDAATGNARLAVRLRGVRDNALGVGTKVEALAGAWRQRVEVRRPLPALFGTGARARVDSVRLVWPGGVLQDEIDVPTGDVAAIEQLDRKGTSCPLLYAWRDGGWRFVTDFLGGSAIGYRLDERTFNVPDPDEYVRVDGGLEVADGQLRLRLNNQLEEVIWFDRAELVVVEHPAGVLVYPHERLMPGPPWPEFRLFASDDVRPVRAARDPGTGRDVTETLVARDRAVVDGFALLPFKGYAAPHALDLDLGEIRAGEPLVLLLDGWIDYADSSANLAAAQAKATLSPPRLLVPDGRGGWRVAIERMGFPAGLPKTMTVPLTGVVDPRDPRVRIETSMRIYWDRARVMRGDASAALSVRRLPPREAVLRDGGLPRPYRPDGRLPDLYDPGVVDPFSPWKAHAGAYTGFGDVLPQLLETDDAFVTTRSGDEIELRFDAPPPGPPGTERTYLLYANGFGKDMDPASGAPETVGPIPFHGMPRYPYGPDVVPPAREPRESARIVPRAEDGLHGATAPALAAGSARGAQSAR